MNFDLMTIPTTLDMGHGGLAMLSLVFIILYIIKGGEKIVEVVKEIAIEKPVEVIKTVEVIKEVEQPLKEATPDAALQLLALLQQEARFIDFVQEDLSGFADAEIGAAARVIHNGSHKVLADYFSFAPVREEEEESLISLPVGFNATQVRLTGNVVGQAPFNGTLVHRGWKVTDVRLPKLATDHDTKILAPAEVEL